MPFKLHMHLFGGICHVTVTQFLFIQSSSNLVRMFVLITFQSSSIIGQFMSKSRSLGQFLEKSCLHSRGHSFGSIFFRLGQNVCLGNISVKFDHGLGGVKK